MTSYAPKATEFQLIVGRRWEEDGLFSHGGVQKESDETLHPRDAKGKFASGFADAPGEPTSSGATPSTRLALS